jgi:acyl-CoA synthetase (AMP-forming)/AMP-acid ligase II
VYAAEVERVLNAHPAVAESAVVGLSDARKGEIPAAAVRVHTGATATPDELLAFSAAPLSDYKRPQRVVIVDALPRTGTEKVDKARCRAFFEERAVKS